MLPLPSPPSAASGDLLLEVPLFDESGSRRPSSAGESRGSGSQADAPNHGPKKVKNHSRRRKNNSSHDKADSQSNSHRKKRSDLLRAQAEKVRSVEEDTTPREKIHSTTGTTTTRVQGAGDLINEYMPDISTRNTIAHAYHMVWDFLTMRRSYPPGTIQHRLCQILDSGWYQAIVFFFTITALFISDILVLTLDKSHDYWVHNLLFLCVVFFLLELTLTSWLKNRYFLSFFFWCDLLGTISIIPDIPWLMGALGMDNADGLVVLRAGRAVRSLRSTRVLRLMRVFRLLRVLRLFKLFTSRNEKLQNANSVNQPPRIGTKIEFALTKRVIMLVILMLFCLPLFEVETIDRSLEIGLTKIDEANTGDLILEKMEEYFLYQPNLLYVERVSPHGVWSVPPVEPTQQLDSLRPGEARSVRIPRCKQTRTYPYARTLNRFACMCARAS